MITIAICDDQPKELWVIEDLLAEYPQKKGNLSIHTFGSAKDLMEKEPEFWNYDIYFLDIVMPEMSGLEIGKLIREHKPDAILIFFTTSKEFALDAYEISALQYLLKPVKKSALFEAMDKALIFVEKKERIFLINARSATVSVKYNEIKFAEYMNHVIYFHVGDKIIPSKSIRVPFDQALKDLFENDLFIQPHRAFLVNMLHIKKMEIDHFVLNNQSIVPVSKNHLKEVREKYMQYLLEGGSSR